MKKILLAALFLLPFQAQAVEPIKIGELASYTRQADFMDPYRYGWQMALDEINAAGGVLGRQIEVISRDDNGQPEDAVRVAQELISKQKVFMLMGGFYSHVGLAISEVAKREKVPYVTAHAATTKLLWESGHPYVFRIQPNTYTFAATMAEKAAKLPAKRWATVSPNYEFGRSIVKMFKDILKEKRPDVEFVGEQWPATGKIDAGSVVQALKRYKPDGIFNGLFGSDVSKFSREARLRGLNDSGIVMLAPIAGYPENMDPIGADFPEGWIVTGYPNYEKINETHKKFFDGYVARYKEQPKLSSVLGYTAMKSVAEGLKAAGKVDREAFVKAAEGIEFMGPYGKPIKFRKVDHQSTIGLWVGKSKIVDGKPVIVDYEYKAGEDYMPSDDYVLKLKGVR